MKKTYSSIRIFENPWLERMTHVHPLTPLILWSPVVAWLAYRGAASAGYSIGGVAAWMLAGVFVWTFAEYQLHRRVFHFNATTPFQKRLQYLIHGLHHDDPNDPTRLVMPPVAAIVLALLLYSLFRGLLGIAGAGTATDPFFAGFLIGYLLYDYTHFWIHHFTPRTSWGKSVKRHHMDHHFVHHDARWGVSSALWDVILGTLPKGTSPKSAAPRASRARS
jgi:sterol desaturase/sphingolipid hydroxylase (fatty acid hydroxylase superfamily)